MGIIESAISNMERLARDDRHGYDQIYRWGERGDWDCSSSVIQSWQRAGVDVRGAGAGYTGNMYSAFTECGFKDVTKDVNLYNGAGLKRGDVLLNHKHHTAMYCGGGYEVEASINEKGGARGGKPGDQTGREFLIRRYRNYPWDCVLRFEEQPEPKWVNHGYGWWYDLGNGKYPYNQWRSINGYWYWFDAYGYAVHDRWLKINGSWYYFNSDCSMATGWKFISGYWYYLNPSSGAMVTGWLYVKTGDKNYWYYLNSDGSMKKGWFYYNKHWYYLSDLNKGFPDGAMLTDYFVLYNNAWYRLGADGVMNQSEDVEFKANESGVLTETE